MNKLLLGTALFFSVALVSCNNSDAPEVDKTIIPAETASPAATTLVGDSGLSNQVVTQLPATTQPALTTTPATAGAALKSGGSSAPNPAHGQPGHRCDIAVGAPLNSAATIPTQPKVQQNVSATPASTLATPAAPLASPVSTDPNAKLNPAHGQPGHDCAIAVGAPLKKN